jgi:hypothetical protein
MGRCKLRKCLYCQNARNITEFAKMRIIEPQKRISQKQKLSSDAAIMAVLMKRQPLGKKELIHGAAIDDSTFSRVEPLLLREEVIKITNDKYYLFNYEGDEILEEVFNQLAKNGKLVVMIEEVADLVGRPPEDIRKQAYKIGKKYGVHIYYNNYQISAD